MDTPQNVCPPYYVGFNTNPDLCIELYTSVPIHRHGQLKCVRLLLEREARMVPDNEGVSPLELCAQENTTVPLTYSSFPGGGDQNLRGNSLFYIHTSWCKVVE